MGRHVELGRQSLPVAAASAILGTTLPIERDHLIDGRVRCGSGTDLRRHHQEGLLLGAKRT